MSTEGNGIMITSTHHDEEIATELAALQLHDKPDGPAAAMMVSAGIGIFVLDLLTTLAEASTDVKDWLRKWEWGQGVGPLAGKTTIASLAYIVSLVVLWLLWRDKDLPLKKSFYIGVILGALGALGTFPTFFQAFAE